MSSFKKQAIKLKQEFQEKGFSVPLVSVQEALAKSYGFNNRHVALSKEKEMNQMFATLHQSQPTKKEIKSFLIKKYCGFTRKQKLPCFY